MERTLYHDCPDIFMFTSRTFTLGSDFELSHVFEPEFPSCFLYTYYGLDRHA